MSAREITLDDIDALAVGARILGTDSSSTPYLRLLNMLPLYAEGHRAGGGRDAAAGAGASFLSKNNTFAFAPCL